VCGVTARTTSAFKSQARSVELRRNHGHRGRQGDRRRWKKATTGKAVGSFGPPSYGPPGRANALASGLQGGNGQATRQSVLQKSKKGGQRLDPRWILRWSTTSNDP